MINMFKDLLEFFGSLFKLLYNVLTFCLNSFLNGIQFFISTFTNIPLFILDLFEELPPFYRIGISGVFGLLILVVFLKIATLVKP